MSTPNGAAAEFVAKKFGGGFRTVQRVVAVDAASLEAVAGDPDRVALVLVNAGATTITVGYHSPMVSAQGIQLIGSGAIYSVNVDQDTIIPAWPHYAIGSAAGGSLYVAEVIKEIPAPKEGA